MGYKYIGSKARIAEDILTYIGSPKGKQGVFIDAFSGTGAVAEQAANFGWPVHINDIMVNAVIMSEARLVSSYEATFSKLGGYKEAINYLNALQGCEGFIWREYSPASKNFAGIERKYFTEENAKKIDIVTKVVHEWIRTEIISKQEFAILMNNIISATNNIANIAGTYGCFLSKWTTQALAPFKIEQSQLRNDSVNYAASNLDVFDLKSNSNDIVYLDPPYTKRQYASYYHILETIVCGDEPKVEGVAGLRPWKEKSSVFCYKSKALHAITKLMLQQKANRVVLSYSNEGHVSLDELVKTLSEFGNVAVISMGEIGRYRPNQMATNNNSVVEEYLIDFRKMEN